MKKTKNCTVCDKEFTITGDIQALRRKTCSVKCRRKLKKNTCSVCKTKFLSANRGKKYCTTDCERKNNLAKIHERREAINVALIKKNKKLNYEQVGTGLFKFEDNVLTLHNYKEPLTKIEKSKGFGWYGTIAGTLDKKHIQCHMCGNLQVSLPGHIQNKHKTKVRDYRETFGLGYKTALVSEQQRMDLKQRTLNWLKSMTAEERKAYLAKQKQNLKDGRSLRGIVQPKKTLEQMNKEGTCPDQTLDQIKKVKEAIGHVPSKKEFINEQGTQRFVHLIYKYFGSWSKAIKMCHFDQREFIIRDNKGAKIRNYSDNDLLEYLRIYAEENRQIPTISDFRRGALPSYETYTKRFGNIENARRLAGVYDFVEDETFRYNQSKHFRKKPRFNLA